MLLMLLDDSDPHVAPLCIHNQLFDPSLQQSDGVGILVHPTTLFEVPSKCYCGPDCGHWLSGYGSGDEVEMWRCFHSTGHFTHRSYFWKPSGFVKLWMTRFFVPFSSLYISASFFYPSVVEYRILYAGFLRQGGLISIYFIGSETRFRSKAAFIKPASPLCCTLVSFKIT